MNKKQIAILLLLAIPLIPLFSQSNEVVDRFLNQEKADLATSAWLVCLASRSLPDDATPEQAMEYLINSPIGERYRDKAADSPIEYRDYAHIVMSELELPGGLMYSLFKSPRYAAREMSYRRWMPGKPTPGTELTPWEVMTALSQVLAWKEEHK